MVQISRGRTLKGDERPRPRGRMGQPKRGPRESAPRPHSSRQGSGAGGPLGRAAVGIAENEALSPRPRITRLRRRRTAPCSTERAGVPSEWKSRQSRFSTGMRGAGRGRGHRARTMGARASQRARGRRPIRRRRAADGWIPRGTRRIRRGCTDGVPFWGGIRPNGR